MPLTRQPGAGAAPGAPNYARRGLFVLFLIAILNLMDRNVLIVMQEPIKRELMLSDAQLGGLTGLSFALLYTLAAFPIAALADRWVRTRLLAGAVVIWSVMTGLSGFAANYVQLVALRMGVAAGEAGSIPATHSLLSDYYPPHQRSLAFALWGQSQPLGVMAGFLAGGYLSYAIGWRGALIGLGIVGIAMVPLVLWMREPARGTFDEEVPPPPPPLIRVPGLLWRNRTARFLLAGGSVHCLVLYTVQSWSAPFYSRAFGMALTEAAVYLTFVVGAAGCLGVLFSGMLVRRLGRRDPRWYMWLPAVADLLLIPLLALQFLTHDQTTSLVAGFVAMMLLNAFIPCTSVTLQTSVTPSMRAVAAASSMFCLNIIGLGIGPLLTGAISDALIARGMVAESLRYAVLATVVFAPLAAFFFHRAAIWMREMPQARALSGVTEPSADQEPVVA